jgi:hypothetical protein
MHVIAHFPLAPFDDNRRGEVVEADPAQIVDVAGNIHGTAAPSVILVKHDLLRKDVRRSEQGGCNDRSF